MQSLKAVAIGTAIGTATVTAASAVYYTAITTTTYCHDPTLYNFAFMPEGRYIGISKEKLTLLVKSPPARYASTCRVELHWSDLKLTLKHADNEHNDRNAFSICLSDREYNLQRFKNDRVVR